MNEYERFPKSVHDDCIDPLSQYFNFMRDKYDDSDFEGFTFGASDEVNPTSLFTSSDQDIYSHLDSNSNNLSSLLSLSSPFDINSQSIFVNSGGIPQF